MAKLILYCAAALLLSWGGTACGGTLDLQLGVASEAVFRGVVQNNSPTGSLRAEYRVANRAIVGARVLNNRSAGTAQLDFQAGLAKSLVLLDLIPATVDGGINVSIYTGDGSGPQQRDLDWAEAWAAIDSGPVRLSAAFAPDYFGTGAAAWRMAGQLRWPLGSALDAVAVLGWNDGGGVRRHLLRRGGAANYADYSVVLTRTLPHDLAIYGQIAGASREIDDTSRPRALVGIRWRWGRQLP